MVRSRSLLPLVLLVALAGCDALSDEAPAVVTGTVVNAETNRPITGATVQFRSMGVEVLSDSVGGFAAELAVDSSVVVEITAFKTGYQNTSTTTTVEPGQALSVPALLLVPSEVGSDGTSGPAASITLSERTPEAVGVSEAGGVETATLEFIVLDADENPVDNANGVDLAVEIIQGPGGGEFLSPAAPETVRTDENGRATVTLTSGTQAGVVQIETRATTADGRTIRSQPIALAIHGGFPDQAHFTIATTPNNSPCLRIQGCDIEVTALVGDRYANPVQPGTQVYFTASTGVISGSSPTDAVGLATSTLLTGNPFPLDGYGTITARTSGADGEQIEATTLVLLSGRARVTLLTAGMGLGPYDYVVSDQNGNPLAKGTTISVTVTGQNVKALGDVETTLGDEVLPGPGLTEFTFSIVADDPSSDDVPAVQEIKIEVTSPNGNVSAIRTGDSARRAGVQYLVPGVPVEADLPADN